MKDMEINWVVVGWIIDVILNGIVWLVIAALLIPIIEVSDKWMRKGITFMDKADKLIKKFIESSFEWIEKNNLNILFAFLFVILFGILAEYEIIPKIIR
tara:strand:+ start:47 stop:343 length:297 start_codon:yes stop_codon:yes gene_type:complete